MTDQLGARDNLEKTLGRILAAAIDQMDMKGLDGPRIDFVSRETCKYLAIQVLAMRLGDLKAEMNEVLRQIKELKGHVIMDVEGGGSIPIVIRSGVAVSLRLVEEDNRDPRTNAEG